MEMRGITTGIWGCDVVLSSPSPHPLHPHISHGMLIAYESFRMTKRTCVLVSLIIVAVPATARSQTGIRPPQGWSLGISGGAAAFSDMQRGSVRVFRPTPQGMEEREMARRVGAETSTTIGGYLAYWPSRNWGMRLHGSFAPSRFETMMQEADAEYAGIPSSSDEGERLAGLSIVSADLQLLFRLPTIKDRVMLYGIVGGGAARYAVQNGEDPVPEEAEGDFEGGVRVRPAGVLGLGAMLPFRNRAFRLHFELTNTIAATPLKGGYRQAFVASGGEELEFDPRDEPAGERRVYVMNGVRFTIGASFSPNK